MDLDKIGSEVDYSTDFFGRKTNLTVSGQLEAELAALALGQVYTFGPTFRAENSNTSRHLSEFWMIEPEIAFADLEENMDLAEEFLKYCIQYCIINCENDLRFLDNRLVEEEKNFKKEERSENDLSLTLSLIKKYNIVKECYKKADHFINLASNSLSVFNDSEEKKILEKLTSFSLERNF